MPNQPITTRIQRHKEGYLPARKMPYLNLDQHSLSQHKKMEDMALMSNNEILLAIDNDFGIGDLLDPKTGKLKKITNQKSSHFYRIKL